MTDEQALKYSSRTESSVYSFFKASWAKDKGLAVYEIARMYKEEMESAYTVKYIYEIYTKACARIRKEKSINK